MAESDNYCKADRHEENTPSKGFERAVQNVDPARLEKPITTLFDLQVAAGPTRLAVKSGSHALSYTALNEVANGIAHDIAAAEGIGNDPVALLLPPEARLVPAILGALKAGKICVPVRPARPLARIHHVLESTGARLIVTDSNNLELAREVQPRGCQVLQIDTSQPRRVYAGPCLPPDNPAYVLYTSGSTGEPRGVVHTHRTLLHLVVGSTDALRITPDDRIGLMPSSSFIGTARCIFGALVNGASVHPFDVTTEGLRRFADWLAAEQITIYHFAPTFFRHFVASLDGRVHFPRLRLVYLGGEPVRRSDVDSFRKHFAPDAVLVNGYGSTEAGAIRRYFIDRETPIDGALVPVGYSVADKEVVILDEVGNLLGLGCVGEIAVKSRYLSPGYWREPQATRRAFSETAGEEVLYRTGDLGRLSADGCLEHLGRKDSQIKIRGHRINSADVEKALLDIPMIADVAVVARPDKEGELRLVAYIASSGGRAMTVGSVRRALEKFLPAHSIPTSFVFMVEIPRSPTGKVEVSALPDPPSARPNLDQPKAPPRTELEGLLVELWSDVLGVEQIGIFDSFLDLGGDSLSATRLLNRVQNRLLDPIGEFIYMTAVFDSPTVADFAEYLERNYPQATFGLGRDGSSTNASGTEHKQGTTRRTRIDESALARLRQLIASAYSNSDWGSPVKNRRMVFLLCSSRSGSTLLRVILSGHPQLFAPPELRLLAYNTLAEREASHSGENAMMLEGAIRAVMQVSGRSAVEAADLMGQLANNGTTSAGFYRLLQDWIGDALLVDKTPSYALHPPALANAEAHFDEPYYIHLVRHPAGVIRSSEEMRLDLVSPYRQYVSSASELAEMLWLISHQNILRFLKGVPAARQHRVQFENLVQQPELVVRHICEFLKLEFDFRMLRPYENQSAKMTDGIHPETKMIGDPKFHRHRDINPTAAHRWKDHGRECHLADVTWALAEMVGYQRS